MIKSILKIFISGFIMLLAIPAAAQSPSASATLERDSLLIGDQVNLTLQVSVPAEHLISWPAYEDTLVNHIEIIKKTGIDTMPAEDPTFKTYYQKFLITSFDSGSYLVPSIQFSHGAKDDTITEVIATRPFYIQVHTVEVDTAKAIMPIKPPLQAPLTIAEVLPWILISLGVILLGLFIFYYIKKRRSAQPVFKIRTKPKLPAHVIALNDLEDLRQKKLWQAGKVKEYYTDLTDIVRLYIEERFGINAIEMTTDEIISDLRDANLETDQRNKLGQTLVLADLVKFAKENPLPLDNDNSLSKSIEFVKDTIPAQQEPEEKDQGQDTKEKEIVQN